MKNLKVDGLTCSRGALQLFNNLSFMLRAGQILRLSGENGCGKTSALKAIAGILPPVRGNILLDGAPLSSHDLLYLDHKLLLKPFLTVHENITFWAQLHHAPNGSVERAYEELGLTALQDIPVRSLSQGQCKRVQLSLLFLKKAFLWLLDEPFNSLDGFYTSQLKKLFEEHLKHAGLIIYASHIPIPGLQEEVLNLREYTDGICNAA